VPAPGAPAAGTQQPLAAFRRVAQLLSSSKDFNEVIASTLQACLPVLGDFGFFDLRVGAEVIRTVRAHEDEATEAALRPTRWMPQPRDDGFNLCALTTGAAAFHPEIDDAWYTRAAATPQHLAGMRALAFRSMISVPMRYGAELLGSLTLFMARSGRRHSADDLALAQDLAALAAPVVANARLLAAERSAHQSADQSRRRLEMLSAAGAHLAGTLDPRVTLERIAELLVPTVVDWCRIDLVEPDGSARVALVRNRDLALAQYTEQLAGEWRAPVDTPGTIDWVIAHGQPFRGSITTGETALLRDPRVAELIRKMDVRDSLMVPLIARGRTLGAMAVLQADSGRRFSAEDEVFMTQLAQRAALALDNARLYADAEAARHEAERANRAKDEFLAVLGHELRNPLAPIVTALSLMERRGDSAARERQIIARQVGHLSRLVDDLLDVSRIAQGRVALQLETLDLSALVAETVEAVRPSLQAQDVDCRLRLPEAPLYVRGDRVRLAQVLNNLLLNARKFTPPGGAVTTRLLADGEDWLELSVEDTGSGIAPELLPQVFNLFVQGPQSIARQQGGLGLGLAIARSMVTMHGGQIGAESAGEGCGATFRVRLPRVQAGERSAPERVAPRAAAVTAPGRRVLVVDDNADAREMLQALLEAEGYEARGAADARSALQCAASFRPQLAVVDIGLPGVDGYTLAAQLRAEPALAGLRLVALTGYGREPDRTRALAAGFDEHLVKPVAIDALLAALKQPAAEPAERSTS
jgi:signal transduction histidine kinase/CheY-like chemotaxis protein